MYKLVMITSDKVEIPIGHNIRDLKRALDLVDAAKRKYYNLNIESVDIYQRISSLPFKSPADDSKTSS